MTRLLAAVGLSLASAGCLHAPYAVTPCERPDLTGCVIEDVSVTGSRALKDTDIKEKIATAESSHALGGALENVPILSLWDRITVDYEKLDPFVLERDLARVERLYRSRGYYDARARVARVIKVAKRAKVRVEIVVEEGEPVKVGPVERSWVGNVPGTRTANAVTSLTHGLKAGTPFDETKFEEIKKRIQRSLTDHGYAYAEVTGKAEIDLVKHEARVVFTIDAGPHCKFGTITLEGYGDLPVERLRRAVDINEGDSYSTDKLDAAQLAISDLRVVGSVEAVPQLKKETRDPIVPVIFKVTPTTLRTVKLGGGAEVGSRILASLVAGWDNRNFLGGLRHFSVEAKPDVVFYPYSIAGKVATANLWPLPEMHFNTALVQPGFLEARTRGLVSLGLNWTQLLPTDTLGYLELATKAGLERDFWGSRVHVGVYGNMSLDQPMNYCAQDKAVDPLTGLSTTGPCHYKILSDTAGYHFLALPVAQIFATLDLRYGADGKRDPVNPHSGFYLSNDVQFGLYGSQDVRIRPEMRGYIPMGRHVTLAMRVTGGYLAAYGGLLGDSKHSDPADAEHEAYVQLLQLRGFTSGGPTSNRGYVYNGIGPQEAITSISPRLNVLDPSGKTLNGPDGKPGIPLPIALGGAVLWEASVELRFPLFQALGAEVFLEGSDVRQSFKELGAPIAPHLSTGFGLRYVTPVGPLRADFGVRIPGAQVIGSKCKIDDPSITYTYKDFCDPASGVRKEVDGGYLDPKYGQSGTIFGLPLAISIAVGDAF